MIQFANHDRFVKLSYALLIALFTINQITLIFFLFSHNTIMVVVVAAFGMFHFLNLVWFARKRQRFYQDIAYNDLLVTSLLQRINHP